MGILNNLTYVFFSGYNSRDLKLVSFENAVQLIFVVPGRIAKAIRSKFASIITRYMAGDKYLHQEIAANSASGAPVAKMARMSIEEASGQPSEQQSVGLSGELAPEPAGEPPVVWAMEACFTKGIGTMQSTTAELIKTKDEFMKVLREKDEELIQAHKDIITSKDETIQAQLEAMNAYKVALGK